MGQPNDINLTTLNAPALEYLKKYGAPTQPLPPVVCIPGVAGNQLYAKLNKSASDHWFCQNHQVNYMIWLALAELLPGVEGCWSQNIKLQYDSATARFMNATGVDILVQDFGSTLGFEYLDPSFQRETIYFASIVQNLITVGYQRGKNIFGTPYDWRLAPNSTPALFTQLQKIIEDAYTSNNNSKVVIIAHSMGNLIFSHLLSRTPQGWREKYIKNYFAIAPPWTGAVMAVQSLASGYDFSIPYLPAQSARPVQRSFESNYFLLPRPDVWKDSVFITTPKTTYSAKDYASLFDALGMKDAYTIWNRTKNLVNPMNPPNVDTYCFYGHGLATHVGLTYKDEIFDKPPVVTIGDGDGTVPLQSLTYCQNWQSKMPNKLVVKGYDKQEHVAILTCPDMLKDIIAGILGTQ